MKTAVLLFCFVLLNNICVFCFVFILFSLKENEICSFCLFLSLFGNSIQLQFTIKYFYQLFRKSGKNKEQRLRRSKEERRIKQNEIVRLYRLILYTIPVDSLAT